MQGGECVDVQLNTGVRRSGRIGARDDQVDEAGEKAKVIGGECGGGGGLAEDGEYGCGC